MRVSTFRRQAISQARPAVLLFTTALAAAACTRQSPVLANLPCDAGRCADGWVCHPETQMCVPEIDIGCGAQDTYCPSEVETGSRCLSPDSFIPCADSTSGCELGCRTCREDGTWSECSPGDCELGQITSCSSCTDDCTALANVAETACEVSGVAAACAIISCTPGFADLDGRASDGCEAPCVPSNGGVESCDGADNDCNGMTDDVDPLALAAECNALAPGGQVAVWSCEAGSCAVADCLAGHHDLDGGGDNGCEYECTSHGIESCNGADDDCDGSVDNAPDGAPGCTTFYRDEDGDDVGLSSDSRCTCAAAAPYSVTTGGDCDDTRPTCVADCTTDLDADLIPDCVDTCVDADGDGYGTAGGAGDTCSGTDCNEGVATCTNDCSTNLDGDPTPDCADTCIDLDRDGRGTAGGAGNACAGTDCHDGNDTCAADCRLCVPAYLILTADSPVAACAGAGVSIDIDGRTGAAAEISCATPTQALDGPDGFETGSLESWSQTSLGIAVRGWPDSFPPSCPTTGRFGRMDRFADRFMQLATPLDATGIVNIRVSALVGYRSADAAQQLSLLYCCGAGCTATNLVATYPSAAGGGTDACRVETATLPVGAENCASLMLRFEWPWGRGRAGLDDIMVSGDLPPGPITEVGGGVYSSSISSCTAGSVQLSCTWSDTVNSPQSATAEVVFQ